MSRVVLMVIFGLSAAMYFPDSRQAIIDRAMPVLTPILRRAAVGEMDKIASELITYDRIGRPLPSRREWLGWLDDNYTADGGIDPWGSIYQFRTWPDSFVIVSFGPDKERNTEDDIRLSRTRTDWRRR